MICFNIDVIFMFNWNFYGFKYRYEFMRGIYFYFKFYEKMSILNKRLYVFF